MDGFLEEIKTPSDDERFLDRVFSKVAREIKEKRSSDLEKVLLEEYESLSLRLEKSKFQESCSVRNVLKSRKLASLLINDEGELDLPLVKESIQLLEEHSFVLGKDRHLDSHRNIHMKEVLKKLYEDNNLQRLLKMISKPTSHKVAEQVIRDTLQLPPFFPITDTETRRAALAAWLCYLRQNVGSCFATAPAILVQIEQPELFLKDISELLATGRLKRVIEGMEYAVPLSHSWGGGDLRRPIQVSQDVEEAGSLLKESPGVMAGLEAAGIFNGSLSSKEKREKSRELAEKALREILQQEGKPVYFLTAEDLLSAILLGLNGIKESDVADYRNRPKEMMQAGLIQATPIVGRSSKGKSEACALYLAQMEKAGAGFKSLADNALLKTWEFTLASFAETKPSFTRWNMYASLGFNSDEPGGIAHCLYEGLKQKLDSSNAKVQEFQLDYEQAHSQLKYIEARLRSASSEKEVQWLRIEYETRRNEFHTIEELRDKEHEKAKRLAGLLETLLESYDKLFPQYFQEVYDPDMHEVAISAYDDSPAGFRLLYKHGRSNTAVWSLIYSPHEFTQALSSFFIATEVEFEGDERFVGMKTELADLISRLVVHVKSDQFLESAFYRMAKAYRTPLIKDPLNHLEKIDKKPWAYTSGGTMSNLMSCYFGLADKPYQEERWVENEMELLIFFLEGVRKIPDKELDSYFREARKGILMHSPTHAFSLHPGYPKFKEAVESKEFTYTWLRDNFVRKHEGMMEVLFLDEEEQNFLIDRIGKKIPLHVRPLFKDVLSKKGGRKNPREFRRWIIQQIEENGYLRGALAHVVDADFIDAVLFSSLPLSPYGELLNRSERMFSQIPGMDKRLLSSLSECMEQILRRWKSSPYATSKQLIELCLAALIATAGQTSIDKDFWGALKGAAQKLGYSLPPPLIFADTNWVKDTFAFVVNPGTSLLEFWRCDPLGVDGSPISVWKNWLNGSNKERTWGVYIKPSQYIRLLSSK
jgi:hypothetical protein